MDQFWVNLPLIITAIGGFYAIYKQNQRLGRDVKENTQVTVQGQQAVFDKVDSAEKKADATAAIAVKAVSQGVLVSHKQNEALKNLDDKLNGGPGGLHSLTDRMSKLEEGQESLKRDHKVVTQSLFDINKTLGQLGDKIERRMV